MSGVTQAVSLANGRAAVPNELIFRLSVDQYHQMIRAGILTDDDPIELLEGWLVYKMPKNRQHSIATRHTREMIEQHLPQGWYVDSQEPITTAESEPEPDVCVIRGHPDDYPDRHPRPQDIALLVEVADTTLDRDRGFKKRLYAQAGIPIYWVVNLQASQVEVYSQPSGPHQLPDYHQRQDYDASQSVPFVIEGREVGQLPVRQLLP
jgi:Uma2 family endonuclease